jgi:uncharacterized repeat protein (TIGR03803 family)
VAWNFSGTDGSQPASHLVLIKECLYGTTHTGGQYGFGTVFCYDPYNNQFNQIYSFGASGQYDGRYAGPGLVLRNNYLYGTTDFGGQNNYGTVFRCHFPNGPCNVTYSFKGPGAPTPDGANPYADLLTFNGASYLYGTTYQGGSYNEGTVYRVTFTATASENVLCHFHGAPDGARPDGALIKIANDLWGTTRDGGSHNLGSIFSCPLPNGGGNHVAVVHWSFLGQTMNDGSAPNAALLKIGPNGNFHAYGTTLYGGPSDSGTVFDYHGPSGVEVPITF